MVTHFSVPFLHQYCYSWKKKLGVACLNARGLIFLKICLMLSMTGVQCYSAQFYYLIEDLTISIYVSLRP